MNDNWSEHPSVESFTTAVLDVFGSEPWTLAEPFIERAWCLQKPEGEPAWSEIRGDLERAWALQQLREDQSWSEIRDAVRFDWLAGVGDENLIGTGELWP